MKSSAARAIEAAEGRLRTCSENHQLFKSKAAEARVALDTAQAIERAAKTAHEAALLGQKMSPGVRAAKRLEKMQAQLRPCAEDVVRTRATLSDEDDAVRATARAVDEARNELGQAKRALAVEGLVERASVSGLRAQVAPRAGRILAMQREIEAEAAAIDAAYAASLEASSELRDLGEASVDLGLHHIAFPFLFDVIEEYGRVPNIDGVCNAFGRPPEELASIKSSVGRGLYALDQVRANCALLRRRDGEPSAYASEHNARLVLAADARTRGEVKEGLTRPLSEDDRGSVLKRLRAWTGGAS